MAMPGKGCFVGWYDLVPGREADHDHWHTHEHMTERVAIPGFLRGLRYRSLVGSPRTCIMYQVEALETLNSPAYLARLNNPTPWSTRTLREFVGMNRTMCRVLASAGLGIGGYLLTIQFSPEREKAAAVTTWLSDIVLPDLSQRAGLCGAHLLRGDTDVSNTPTEEKSLRGEPDSVADWILLVEGYDQGAVEQAKGELLGQSGLYSHSMSKDAAGGLYRLDYAIGQDEAKAAWTEPEP